MMNWYVIYTKPRNEKKVAANLQAIGIESFCPTVSILKQWSDRRKIIKQPLLASYVFVKVNEKEREKVFQIPGVVRYLFWLGKPVLVREEDMLVFKDSLKDKYKDFYVSNSHPGDKIVLNNGVFKGHTAVVVEQIANKTILKLDGLGVRLILEK